jgi:hypothetical protein
VGPGRINGPQIRPSLQQVRRERVPQRMTRHMLLDPRRRCRPRDRLVVNLAVNMMPPPDPGPPLSRRRRLQRGAHAPSRVVSGALAGNRPAAIATLPLTRNLRATLSHRVAASSRVRLSIVPRLVSSIGIAPRLGIDRRLPRGEEPEPLEALRRPSILPRQRSRQVNARQSYLTILPPDLTRSFNLLRDLIPQALRQPGRLAR